MQNSTGAGPIRAVKLRIPSPKLLIRLAAGGATLVLEWLTECATCLLEVTLMKATFLFAVAVVAMQPQLTAGASELDSTWTSQPRGLVTIVVGEDGGRMAGPGWEHRFEAIARDLDLEIAPGRRFVLHRSGDRWVGEYFHPRIGPGTWKSEAHKMTFDCGSGECTRGR